VFIVSLVGAEQKEQQAAWQIAWRRTLLPGTWDSLGVSLSQEDKGGCDESFILHRLEGWKVGRLDGKGLLLFFFIFFSQGCLLISSQTYNSDQDKDSNRSPWPRRM